MNGAEFRVTGTQEVARALERIGDDLPDALHQASRTVAGGVEEKAQAKARGRGGVAGKSAPALGVEDGPEAAAVVLDATAYPFALGAEFGAIAYPQFEAWRGSEDGYFLHPAIRDTDEQSAQSFVDAVDELIARAGF